MGSSGRILNIFMMIAAQLQLSGMLFSSVHTTQSNYAPPSLPIIDDSFCACYVILELMFCVSQKQARNRA
jgi:hypothetical protein